MELITALPTALKQLGQTCRAIGHIWGPGRVSGTSPFGNGEDGLVALGYLAETSAQLITAADALVAARLRYACAALIRQLVELDYLTWAFAHDDAEAADWLRSTREQRLSRWQPRHLRKRSKGLFDAADYQQHCELGGHPTPDGSRTLLEPAHESVLDETLRYELCRHGTRIWQNVLLAANGFGEGVVLHATTTSLDGVMSAWDSAERLGVKTSTEETNRGPL